MAWLTFSNVPETALSTVCELLILFSIYEMSNLSPTWAHCPDNYMYLWIPDYKFLFIIT